jgi:hypothetical protein
MSPFLLVTVVVCVLMAKRLSDMYLGGEYACPSCGSRSARRHAPDCSWNDRRGG